jgi:hypothetical protein
MEFGSQNRSEIAKIEGLGPRPLSPEVKLKKIKICLKSKIRLGGARGRGAGPTAVVDKRGQLVARADIIFFGKHIRLSDLQVNGIV